MKRLIVILIVFFWSCSLDNKQLIEFRDATTFIEIFQFAFNNRESKYFDSAVFSLNDSIKRDKNFYLRIYEDSIQKINLSGVNYELRKENIALYSLNKRELLYLDSIYSTKHSIDKMISYFIKTKIRGAIYLYSDTIINKSNWKDLFLLIDDISGLYKIAEMPLRLVVYFKNPFTSPPSNLQKNYRTPMINE